MTKRRYFAQRIGPWFCEHCDGENSPKARDDYLRGMVCPVCDEAIDAMEADHDPGQG
jgi:hypothetical protein